MRDHFPKRPPRAPFVRDTPVYFVTFCTHRRQPTLANADVHEAFLEFCHRANEQYNIAVGRYVIMPDHVHLFVCGDAMFDLGRWVKSLKQALRRVLPMEPDDSRIWQEGFFDHILRDDENMGQKWEYMRENPVRAGLVQNMHEWPYQGEIVRIDRA